MPNVGVSPNRGARYAAKLAGERVYVTGRPCVNGHNAPRDTRTAQCIACRPAFLAEVRRRENARRRADPRKHLWKVAKARAAERDIEFTIEPSDVPEIPTLCPILLVPLTETAHGLAGRATAPSLDRIDPQFGYIPGNLQILSWRANVLKGDATPEDIEKLYRWSLSRQEAVR